MTEYWKSKDRHYCEAIRTHEQGKGHQDNYIAKQKALRASKTAAAAAAKKDEADWAKIDAAAQKAYEQDLLASGGGGARTQHITPTLPTPSPETVAKPVGIIAGGAIRPSHALKPTPAASSSSSSKPQGSTSPWIETIDPATGATYYYNIHTLVTSWTKPDEDVELKKGQKRGANEESKSDTNKKQKTDAAAAATPSSSTTAQPLPVAPVEIDEDTGFGKWSTVDTPAPAAEAEPDVEPSTKPKKRMTPFGMIEIQPNVQVASQTNGATATSSTGVPPVSARYSNFAADDADDADDDGPGGPIDLAQQLRNQFGPSSLIHAKGRSYEAGVDLLAEEDPNATKVAVTFKKKTNRGTKKPVAATNH